SRGAIAAAALGVAAAAALGVWRRRLARRRHVVVACVVGAVLVCAAGVVAWGVRRDGLPTKTMTFRWYYWTAGARIARDRPLFGVGPANFDSAYTRYRRVEGEEAVKLPHNAAVHAAATCGILGGLAYLAVLGGALVSLARPAPRGESTRPSPSVRLGDIAGAAAGLAAAVLLARAAFTHAGASGALLVIEALGPAAVLGGAVLLAGWTAGRDLEAVADAAPVRIALGCAVAAFALHNMVSFSLWTPGAAMIFWAATGALLGRTASRSWRMDGLARPKAVAAAGALVAAVVLLWLPVWRRAARTEAVAEALLAGQAAPAARHAVRAAEADPLDPVAAGDAARALLATGHCATALDYADKACARDRQDASWYHLAASVARRCARRGDAPPDRNLLARAADSMRQAVRRDPQDASLRLEYARLLADLARWDACAAQLEQAERIDAVRRRMDSGFRLTPAQREELQELRRRVERR
ncbi:MAG: O-antigen ligase family protein, partial [Planctomycetota bacterium]